MSHRPPEAEQQLRFLRQFQRLLDEGSFVATYKFALLHAIADLCVAKGDDSGAPLELSTEDIAERFVELYWPQTVPFLRGEDRAVLMQNTGNQAAVVTAVRERREGYGGSLANLRRDPDEWRRLLRDVRQTVQKMPLWRLQTVGEERVEFLYPNLDQGAEIHDLAVSSRVAEWAYEQVARTEGRVWVRGSEPRLLGKGWRGFMGAR